MYTAGLLTFKDKSYYRGDFKMEHMSGRGGVACSLFVLGICTDSYSWYPGVFVGADGTQYDGDWRNNMRQGIGTLLSEGKF
jgi:hypothetical protein